MRYKIKSTGLVSVIVPTRDHGEDVDRCLTTFFEKTTYKHFEIVLLDNGSTDPEALATSMSGRKRDKRIRIVRYDVPFNFSQINNHAVTQSKGPYLLFLNNDTELIMLDWIEAMVEDAQRPLSAPLALCCCIPTGPFSTQASSLDSAVSLDIVINNYPGDAPGYFLSALKICQQLFSGHRCVPNGSPQRFRQR